MKNPLSDQLIKLANSGTCEKEIVQKYLKRIKEGKLIRDENPKSHFCVYFAAFDSSSREVFVGRHKKSGKLLFNGGHIDKSESISQTLEREMGEEWGLKFDIRKIGKPGLLTITTIGNDYKYTCRKHFDIWYFVKVDKIKFNPDYAKLEKEFDEMKWMNIENVKRLSEDSATLRALDFIKNRLLKSCFYTLD